jgi:hypothetical protein
MRSVAIVSGLVEIAARAVRPRPPRRDEARGGVAPADRSRSKTGAPVFLSPPATPEPAPRSTDRRYRTQRWRRLREAVLRRDGYACRVVAGCQARATVADHVSPVYPGMPDDEFFDPRNLRASCRRHNLARGFAAQLDSAPTGVVTGDYS